MKKIQLIILVILSLLLTCCKVQQVNLSKLYNSCWVDNPDNGLDTELKFYENHTAILKAISDLGPSGKIQTATNYTYVYLDGRIILTLNEPDSNLRKNLYVIIKGYTIELSNGTPGGIIVLKRQK